MSLPEEVLDDSSGDLMRKKIIQKLRMQSLWYVFIILLGGIVVYRGDIVGMLQSSIPIFIIGSILGLILRFVVGDSKYVYQLEIEEKVISLKYTNGLGGSKELAYRLEEIKDLYYYKASRFGEHEQLHLQLEEGALVKLFFFPELKPKEIMEELKGRQKVE